MRRPLVLAACLLTAASAAACGGPDTEGARKAAEAYVRELGARDGAGTCAQMTASLQREFIAAVTRSNPELRGRRCAQVMQIALDSIPREQLREFSTAKIEDLRVKDDTGTFRYKLANIQVDGKVSKENDAWRVSCCVPSAGG